MTVLNSAFSHFNQAVNSTINSRQPIVKVMSHVMAPVALAVTPLTLTIDVINALTGRFADLDPVIYCSTWQINVNRLLTSLVQHISFVGISGALTILSFKVASIAVAYFLVTPLAYPFAIPAALTFLIIPTIYRASRLIADSLRPGEFSIFHTNHRPDHRLLMAQENYNFHNRFTNVQYTAPLERTLSISPIPTVPILNTNAIYTNPFAQPIPLPTTNPQHRTTTPQASHLSLTPVQPNSTPQDNRRSLTNFPCTIEPIPSDPSAPTPEPRHLRRPSGGSPAAVQTPASAPSTSQPLPVPCSSTDVRPREPVSKDLDAATTERLDRLSREVVSDNIITTQVEAAYRHFQQENAKDKYFDEDGEDGEDLMTNYNDFIRYLVLAMLEGDQLGALRTLYVSSPIVNKDDAQGEIYKLSMDYHRNKEHIPYVKERLSAVKKPIAEETTPEAGSDIFFKRFNSYTFHFGTSTRIQLILTPLLKDDGLI